MSEDNTCGCRKCLRAKGPIEGSRFIVCAICGNKRCPHATNHNLTCTNSNEPGQAGSIYA